MGDLAPVSTHAGPSARTAIGTMEFFRHTFLQNNIQTSPPDPLELYPGFQSQKWITFCHFPVKIGFLGGLGAGVPDF